MPGLFWTAVTPGTYLKKTDNTLKGDCRMIDAIRWVLVAALLALAAGGAFADEPFDRQLEADWLAQIDRLSAAAPQKAAPRAASAATADDAAGGVDGVKDGKWGFHTDNQKDPWWQVDLGEARAIGRVVIYNRCDALAERNSRIMVLLSDEGKSWRQVYSHNGKVFFGESDGKPLSVSLDGARARFVRLALPGTSYFHLDEVEVYAPGDGKADLALGKPADQSSTSQWSTSQASSPRATDVTAAYPTAEVIRRGRHLAADLAGRGVDAGAAAAEFDAVDMALKAPGAGIGGQSGKELYFRAHRAVRKLALSNPLLNFDSVLITKRQPGQYSHMSDQNYGWWSRPGGGIYILDGLKSAEPTPRCLTGGFEPGSFLGPALSYDGRKVLFAWCKYYPRVAGLKDKADKANIPEDAFYHVYEMNADGSGVRRLTHGKYDDFDARYLPEGKIVFLSTRRGQFFQCGKSSAMATLSADLPDSYVRCGGGKSRPVAVYTLHVMDQDGADMRAISAFENFEWNPAVANDGRILFARWDYVDRHNNAFMSLWATNPDGTNPQAIYGNFTRSPHAVFEAKSIPNSNKIIFTAAAHHSITGGSLVLLDPDVGQDGSSPLTRLTPEVCFPEADGWPKNYYATPWPLSETYYLTSWSPVPLRHEGGANVGAATGVYLFDAFGNLVLIHRDKDISTTSPIPLRPRPIPPILTSLSGRETPDGASQGGHGRMLLVDVYQGLTGIRRGTVKRLRIIGVPAKVQPEMNQPSIGLTAEDPGKCVLGTVPVESDGSAYFHIPGGVNVFFQALDSQGRAVQTMRTVTYVQPGQTLSCIGCHEPRSAAPSGRPIAAAREPSKITLGPDGSWPVQFDRLVQPVLDKHCVRCHKPGGEAKAIAKLDLTAQKSYASLLKHSGLANAVQSRYLAGRSGVNDCVAMSSPLPGMFLSDKPHSDVRLSPEEMDRLVTWLDTYAQRLGSFSVAQERQLQLLRKQWSDILATP